MSEAELLDLKNRVIKLERDIEELSLRLGTFVRQKAWEAEQRAAKLAAPILGGVVL